MSQVKHKSNESIVQNTKITKSSSAELCTIQRDDYFLIVDKALADDTIEETCTERMYEWAPKSIRDLMSKHWRYALSHKNGPDDFIKATNLHRNVLSGAFLAYKYREFYLDARHYAYYGFISSRDEAITNDVHQKPIIQMSEIWPRALFIYLNYDGECLKHRGVGCNRWKCVMRSKNSTTCCQQEIPWSDILIQMGCNNFNMSVKNLEDRDCLACNQCHKCSVFGVRCKAHKVCRHQILFPLESRLNICDGRNKNKVKSYLNSKCQKRSKQKANN